MVVNQMIDTRNWREFKISDIFITNKRGKVLKVPTGATVSKNKLKDGTIPRVTVSNFNNGITGYYANSDDKDYRVYNNFISVSFLGTVFYQPGITSLDMKVHCLKPLEYVLNEYSAGYIVSVIRKAIMNFAYSDQLSSEVLAKLRISLPITLDGQPDWAYMESYMKKIIEESEQSLENLKKSNCNNHLINIKGWSEFCLKDLFNKKTMKGFPKKAESYEDNPDGYHVFGQSIQYQYSRKVILDKKYLHIVNTDYPILAYASSVGEIGMIDENFYRSGDNGAFQGLFPKTQMNKFQILFLLSILKQEFKKFRYDTSMTDTMMIKFKLPVTTSGDPDLQYMENYMKKVMKKSERAISALRAVV